MAKSKVDYIPNEDTVSKLIKINGSEVSNPEFHFIISELLKMSDKSNSIKKREIGDYFGRRLRISNEKVYYVLKVLSEAGLVSFKKKKVILSPKLKELVNYDKK